MGGYLGIEATVELLRDHQGWVIARDAGAPFSGMAVGSRLLIGAMIAPLQIQLLPRSFARRHASNVNLCELDIIIGPPILVFQRNSTLQHYDAIEIIALGAENCVCVFCDSERAQKSPRRPRTTSLRPDLCHPHIVLTITRRAMREPCALRPPTALDLVL